MRKPFIKSAKSCLAFIAILFLNINMFRKVDRMICMASKMRH